ncbi:cell division protein SepF [Geodermatophilus sp. SYSU D00965]
MAGAMRKMGIYLGLVEDDDARAYGRYDARQPDHADRYDRVEDRRYDRYAADDRYDDRYAEPGDRFADSDYRADDFRDADYRQSDFRDSEYEDAGYKGSGYKDAGYKESGYKEPGYSSDYAADREADLPEPSPEPVTLPRRTGSTRNLGLAPAGTSGTPRLGGLAGATPASGAGSTASGAAGLAAAAAPEPAPAPAPAPAPQPYRITTLHPKTYNEARQIGEAFRDGSPVIMNLTELDHADARRLVDFAAGLIFGLRGSIEPVTNKVFLLSPRDVDVTAEDKARIREGGFFAES